MEEHVSYALSPVTLVLVHGWAGSAEAWDPLTVSFHDAGIEAVHAVRLPGSPGARPAVSYTVKASVEEVVNVARSSDAPVVLIGHSMGAQISLLAHELLQEQLLCEVVVDPAYGASDDSKPRMDSWSQEIDREGHEAVRDFFRSALGALNAVDASRVTADFEATDSHVIADYLRSEYVDADAVGLEAATRAHALKRRLPVLALHSQVAGYEFELSLPRPEGSDVQLWRGRGHFLHLEEPDRFVETIVGFIAASQRQTAPLAGVELTS